MLGLTDLKPSAETNSSSSKETIRPLEQNQTSGAEPDLWTRTRPKDRRLPRNLCSKQLLPAVRTKSGPSGFNRTMIPNRTKSPGPEPENSAAEAGSTSSGAGPSFCLFSEQCFSLCKVMRLFWTFWLNDVSAGSRSWRRWWTRRVWLMKRWAPETCLTL